MLVLDDLHAVANPSCLDVLAGLFEYVPAGSQIAVASREEPALPLARWRAQGSVQEIGVADLRLDEQEAALLLEGAGVELDASEVSELTKRTEGWPAGLYLAVLSMHAGATNSAGIEGFGGDDRFVSEYFRLELIDRLPAADAQFLKYTSVLDRMSGGLCDAVLETTGSAQRLETLERSNRFVIPLDRRGEWYRYHHLFGELLRNELERTEPDVVAALNARAMAWCIASDLPEEAVGYGQAAGETDTVAGLIDVVALPLHYDGRMETLEEWLAWFGDDELAQYPALAVFGAWCASDDRASRRSRALARPRRRGIFDVPLSDGSATIEPWVATLRAHMMPEGVEQALADADAALDQLSPDGFWIPTALLAEELRTRCSAQRSCSRRPLAMIEQGSPQEASKRSTWRRRSSRSSRPRKEPGPRPARRAQAAEALVQEAGLDDYSTSALPTSATARVALHEGRQEDARAALTRAHRLRPMLDHGIPWVTIQVGLELTRAHLALGDAGAARTILAETERVLELRPDMGSLVDEARELKEHVAAAVGPAGAWAMSLTAAELRLLPYLATHFTFPEIGDRLFISRNTVKTEAVAIYRKLSASSRSEAIDRAVEFGLLEPSVLPPRANLTLDG